MLLLLLLRQLLVVLLLLRVQLVLLLLVFLVCLRVPRVRRSRTFMRLKILSVVGHGRARNVVPRMTGLLVASFSSIPWTRNVVLRTSSLVAALCRRRRMIRRSSLSCRNDSLTL